MLALSVLIDTGLLSFSFSFSHYYYYDDDYLLLIN